MSADNLKMAVLNLASGIDGLRSAGVRECAIQTLCELSQEIKTCIEGLPDEICYAEHDWNGGSELCQDCEWDHAEQVEAPGGWRAVYTCEAPDSFYCPRVVQCGWQPK